MAAYVQQQGEGRLIFQVLHLALGAAHGAVLGGAGHAVEMSIGRALVHQHETDDGVVAGSARHPGVDPDVVVLGDVVVAELAAGAGRRLHHAALPQPAVQPAVVQAAVPVVLLDQQLAGIRAIHPLRAVPDCQVLRLARAGVHQHHPLYGLSPEKAYGAGLHRAHPPGRPVLIDLEALLLEHVERIGQLHVAIDIAHERVALHVVHRLVEAHDLRVLVGHVHQHVGGDTGVHVVEPLEEVGIAQRAHADRTRLVVYLRIGALYLELAHVLGNLSQGAVAQQHGAVAVDDGDGVVVRLFDVAREIAVLQGEQARVFLRIARPDAV